VRQPATTKTQVLTILKIMNDVPISRSKMKVRKVEV
jgi:hypothetical protein